jgi:hypothetical protein
MQRDLPIPASLAGDKLKGIERISAFIDEDPRRTATLLRKGILPAGKIGHDWVASRATLAEHYRRLTSGHA